MTRSSSKSCSEIFRLEGLGNRKTLPGWLVSWHRRNPTTSQERRSLLTEGCCGTTRSSRYSWLGWKTKKEVRDAIEKWKFSKAHPHGDCGRGWNAGHAGEGADEASRGGRFAAARGGNSIQRHEGTASPRHGHANRSTKADPTIGGI